MGAAPNEGGVSKTEAIEQLKAAQSFIKEAKSTGLDVSGAEDIYKSSRPLLKQGDFYGAFQIAQQVIQEIEALVSAPEPSLRDSAPQSTPAQADTEQGGKSEAVNKLKEAKRKMSQAKNAGIDTSPFIDWFKDAKPALDRGDFATANEIANEIVQEIDAQLEESGGGGVEADPGQAVEAEAVPFEPVPEVAPQQAGVSRKEAREKLRDTKSFLGDLKSQGFDVNKAAQRFKDAKPLLKQEDYNGAYQVADEVYYMLEQLQGGGGEAETLQPMVPEEAEPQEGTVPMEDPMALAGEEISSLGAAIEQAGQTTDVSEAREQLQMAVNSMNAGDAETALEYTRNARELLPVAEEGEPGAEEAVAAEEAVPPEGAVPVEEGAGGEFMVEDKSQDAVSAIQNAKANLKELKGTGVDVSEARDMLIAAKPAMDAGDFDEVLNICDAVQVKIEELKERGMVDVVKETISNLEKNMGALDDAGAPTDEVEEHITKAKEFISEEKVDEAKEEVEKTKEAMKPLMDKYMGKKATSRFLALQSEVSTAKEEGVDLGEVLPLFDEMKAAFEAKRYGETLSLADKVETGIKNARSKRELVSLLKEAKSKIDEARNAGAEIAHAEDIFNMAKPAVKEKDYEKAMEYGMKALDEAESALIQHNVFNLIQDIQTKVKEADNKSIGIEQIKGNFEQTKNMLEEGDFDGAYALGKQTEMEIDSLLKKFEESKERIEAIEADLSEMKSKGIRSPMAESLVDDAYQALERQDYGGVDEVCSRIQRMMDEGKRRYDEAFGAINRAQAKISEAKTLGASTKEAEVIFNNVSQALDDADYEEAIEYARQAEESAILSKQRYERAFDVVSMAQVKITEAKKIGADVSKAMDFMKQINMSLDEGDYDKVMELARQAENIADETKRVTEQIVDSIQMSKNKIEAMRKKGVDVAEAEKYFNQMLSAVDRTDYQEALKLGEMTLESIERGRLVHEQLVEEIKAAQKKISEAKDLGVEIAKPIAVFNQIPMARNSGDYAKAISLAKDARTRVEEGLKRFQALQKIQETYQRVNDAKKIGSDVSTSEEMLSQAREALKLEDFDGAIRLSKQAAQELATKLLGQSASTIAAEPGQQEGNNL